jgi:RNA polymerase sigma-70 factor (ECF subfamily)
MVGGDQAQAEDLVQDTWIRGLEKLSTFRGEARFASWLTRIGIRMCQDHLRRDRKAPLSLVPSTDLVGGLPDYERRMDLENVLARMPERYRSVLLLHDVEGFTHGEIGELLGIAEGTSKSRLSAARRLGRELLTGKGGRAATESSRQESGST